MTRDIHSLRLRQHVLDTRHGAQLTGVKLRWDTNLKSIDFKGVAEASGSDFNMLICRGGKRRKIGMALQISNYIYGNVTLHQSVSWNVM